MHRKRRRYLIEQVEPRLLLTAIVRSQPFTDGIPQAAAFVESAAQEATFDESQYLPMPLPDPGEGLTRATAAGGLVTYDLSSKRVTTSARALSGAPASAHTEGDPGAAGDGSGSDGAQPLNFGALSLISDPSVHPWRVNVKLFMSFPSGNYVGSGVLIDPSHVLTAGHCVYFAPAGGWANSITVVPAYQNGSQPYGNALSTQLHSFTGWTVNGDFNHDLGVIDLNRPVGAVVGWHGYGYNTADSFFTGNTFHNPGYPAAAPYNGQYMYYSFGNYDYTSGNQAGIYRTSYGGQSGSGSYNIDGSGNRIVYAVLSNGNDIQTNFPRITPDKFNVIGSVISNDIPSTFDLTPLNTLISPGIVLAGSALSSMSYLVENYSSAAHSGTVGVSVYLSTNELISTSDTLIDSHSFTYDFAANSYARINVTAPPTIPSNIAAGDYYIGVILNVTDNNTGNNNTYGADSAPIHVNSAPDLQGYDTYVNTPQPVTWGQTINLNGRVYNDGSVDVTAPFDQDFFLSNDLAFGNDDDIPLGFYYHIDPVPAKGYGPSFNLDVTLPSIKPDGYSGTTFYIGMKTDSLNFISESNEFNNGPGSFGSTYDLNSISISEPPSISINDVTASEGTNAVNTKPFIFTVSLSQAAASPVTVSFASADGTATVADNDYQAVSGTVTFAAGEISKQVIVPVVGDSKVESNETFFLNLSDASGNAIISDATGQATATNDDSAVVNPQISIGNITKKEGGSGVSTSFTFTISLDKAPTANTTVKYATANGTASSSSDYTSKSGTVTFSPGQTSKTVTITVKGDTTKESDEVFFVNLNTPSSNATILDSQAVGTIQNDDSTTSTKVSVITDPTDSTKTALQIFGTNSNDTIDVVNIVSGTQGKSKVTINGSNKGTFSFTGAIIVFGQDGNDKISINSSITRPAFIFGGFGNDTANGGGGADVISGDAGDDQLNGGNGRDILIGGDGKDVINGGNDDDVLITGDVMSIPSFSNLNSLKKEWTRTDADYNTRVNHLQNGGGLNSIKLNADTIFSSNTIPDTASGGSGNDFFLTGAKTVASDRIASEVLLDAGA